MRESISWRILPEVLDDKEARRYYAEQIFFLLSEKETIDLDEHIKSRLMYTDIIASKTTYCLDAYQHFKKCIKQQEWIAIENIDQSQQFFLKHTWQKSVIDINNLHIGSLSDFRHFLLEDFSLDFFSLTQKGLQKKYHNHITNIYINNNWITTCRLNTAYISFIWAPEWAGKKYSHYDDDWYSIHDWSKIKELVNLFSL